MFDLLLPLLAYSCSFRLYFPPYLFSTRLGMGQPMAQSWRAAAPSPDSERVLTIGSAQWVVHRRSPASHSGCGLATSVLLWRPPRTAASAEGVGPRADRQSPARDKTRSDLTRIRIAVESAAQAETALRGP